MSAFTSGGYRFIRQSLIVPASTVIMLGIDHDLEFEHSHLTLGLLSMIITYDSLGNYTIRFTVYVKCVRNNANRVPESPK